MRRIPKIIFFSCLFFCYGFSAFSKSSDDLFYAKNLIQRLLPKQAHDFLLEKISTDNNKDVFELEYNKGKIILRGNNNISLAVALNYYLKYYCHTSVSWYADDPIQLPEALPKVPEKIHKEARCKNRFFLNYCTFGYTMPWWRWKDWERLIDWMALNGINMPLATTGEEAIWYRVWLQLGLSDKEIRSYFTGPAHLPWNRMSNLDRWQGPLPMSYINYEFTLQKRILIRERELDMTPVLPAFAGHVPEALKEKYPKAKITKLSEWGGFPDEYRSYFLDPFDPLFIKIQKLFLQEQEKEFGTNHIYGADPFNEVKPPSLDTAYLADVAKTIYHSINESDSSAVWLMMTWIFSFETETWTKERIKSFLQAVPKNKLMLLDYYCENKEVWKTTDAYFGQPFIWCYLGNFGGNTMLAGNLAEIEKRIDTAFQNAGSNICGIGSTLEGLDANPVIYNYVFEKVWSNGSTNIQQWINSWADSRCGTIDSNCRKAWQLLIQKIYTSPAVLGQATLTNARPCLTGNGNWTTNPHVDYDNKDLLQAWKFLLDTKANKRQSYQYDIVNIGRQVLGNYFAVVRDQFTKSYHEKNIQQLKITGKLLLQILDDMNKLVSTQSSFLLGKWLEDAKKFATDKEERNYYERNARTILTTWGAKGQSLNDYANRSWGGLISGYYKKRWEMFINDVTMAVEEGKNFDEKAFNEKITSFEWNWTMQHEVYSTEPLGNSIEIAKALFKKYELGIQLNR